MKIEINGKSFDVLDLDQVDDYENPKVSVHLQLREWSWFIVAAEKQGLDYYCFGLVDFITPEFGFFRLNSLLENGATVNEDFRPVGMYDMKKEGYIS